MLLDGCTDSGNVDNEHVILVWFDASSSDKMVHTRTSYFMICRPSSMSAESLFCMLQEVLQILGIMEVSKENCSKFVGAGTDGSSANWQVRI